jgi:hypothetical protein
MARHGAGRTQDTYFPARFASRPTRFVIAPPRSAMRAALAESARRIGACPPL